MLFQTSLLFPVSQTKQRKIMLTSRMIGFGSFLPSKIVTNDDLAKMVDTSDEWIFTRTGIRTRHIAGDGESTSTLAIEAAKNALKSAKMEASDIDLIVLATATPDKTFPATASLIQKAIGGSKTCAAFDVGAACSGFVYALSCADGMLKGGLAKTALVIGAETLSRICDWTDRTTCVLFGDGAGAVVLKAFEEDEHSIKNKGVYENIIRSDGSMFDLLVSTGGASTSEFCGKITMNGREVYKHAVNNISNIILELLAKNNLKTTDIDWYVPHQANIRIIESIADKINIPLERFILTIDKTANISSASIPIALDTGIKSGRIKSGDLIMMATMGGGFTWSAGLVRI